MSAILEIIDTEKVKCKVCYLLQFYIYLFIEIRTFLLNIQGFFTGYLKHCFPFCKA